jgi:enterochelin esterase family protein
MNQPRSYVVCLLLALFVGITQAQQPRPIISPEVQPDNRVTFRLRAPNAQLVMLAREGVAAIPMQKNEEGVWSVTTEPLDPDIYGYSFVADGVNLFDPLNPFIKANLIYTQSLLQVPGDASLPWELNDIPHGTIHHHYYKSNVVGDKRDFFVYTPPGYDPRGKRRYPTLYLLHGYSDGANAWTEVGRAERILDNLIAQGKAKPMLVVMPLGYGAPELVAKTGLGFRDRSVWDRNYEKFREALISEVIPQVEKAYLVTGDRESRAIAGLSMGGSEALFTGLNALDHFAWVGAFSSGGLDENFPAVFPALSQAANKQLRTLWISCGKDDRLVEANRKIHDWLNSKGVQHTYLETDGSHTWMVWRRNLSSFVQLLFQ